MVNLEAIKDKLWNDMHNPDVWKQWLIIFGVVILSFAVRFLIRLSFDHTQTRFEEFCKKYLKTRKAINSIYLFICGFLWIAQAVCQLKKKENNLVESAAILVTAFCLYRIATIFSKGKAMPKLIGFGMLIIFGLHQLKLLTPIRTVLTNIQLPLGDISIDIWKLISAIAVLFLLLWLVGVANNVIAATLRDRREIPPSVRVLIRKAAGMLLYIAVFLITLKVAGFSLAGLAVFSGAIGLGLGFGLQKVISNLVSGVIILLDKSIKPGDVIEINGTYGWINTLRTRYVSVLTRDRKEILIPNEDFITNNVVNWSFSDTHVRIRANVGVSYDSDVEKAIELCVQAATLIPRVLKNPPPRCLLIGFGDSSIDLQIRFWINDANEGVANVRSQVLMEVWKAFKKEGIQIPFPQREITIKKVAAEDLPGVSN